MSSSIVILAALDGIAYAALVFLVAVGLSLIFGVLRIVNVAHGSLYAFGAYLAATLGLAVAGDLAVADLSGAAARRGRRSAS